MNPKPTFGDNDAEWGNSAALCPVYDRKSLKVMKYRRHNMAFSEPRIHAQLAAPPAFDYTQDPDWEPNAEKSTSWGFSSEKKQETTSSSSISSVMVGFGYNNETTHEETSGFTVSGMVSGLKSGDRNPARPFFDWNLCWYKCKLAGQTFPVVNYVVKRRQ